MKQKDFKGKNKQRNHSFAKLAGNTANLNASIGARATSFNRVDFCGKHCKDKQY